MTSERPELNEPGSSVPEGDPPESDISDQPQAEPPAGTGQAMPVGDEDQRVTLIHLMLEHMTVEGERFWQRNGVFITIASGLLGLYAIKVNELSGFAHVAYGLVGLIIASGWRQTIIASNYYAERWRVDAREYVRLHPDLADVLRTVAGNSRVPEPKGPKSSVVMIRLAVLSRCFWSAVIVWGAVQVLFVPRPASGSGSQLVCLQFEIGQPVTRVPCPQTSRPAIIEVDWSRVRAIFAPHPPNRSANSPTGDKK